MKSRTLLATILIALGILAFVYQGISYETQHKALDLGPLQVTTQRTRTIPIPPIVGVIAVLSGLVLLYVGGSKPTVPVIGGRD
jgi:uncharacterized membrane protein YidH (DUF202 family)